MTEVNNLLARYLSPDQRRRQTGAAMAEQFNRPTYHDQLPVERSSLFPVGEYPGGQIGFAFPSGAVNALLAPSRAYQGDLGNYQDNRSGFVEAGNAVAGAAMTGGALSPIPRNSLGANRFQLDYFGKSIDILENPSPKETAGFINRTKYKAARQIFDPETRTTYIWDAADPALHAMVAEKLGVNPKTMKSDTIGID